jgi:hypothetical protein
VAFVLGGLLIVSAGRRPRRRVAEPAYAAGVTE